MTGRDAAHRIASVLLALLLAGTGRDALALPIEFDLPAGPASTSITRFAQAAGIAVLFPYETLRQRRTLPLRGRFEVADALALLLRGTGYEAVAGPDGQYSLQPSRQAPPRREPVRPLMPVVLNDDSALPEVAITGTRLLRDGMTMPTPVAAISDFELQFQSSPALVDALAQLPHFLNNDTPQTQSFGTAGSAGASHLNLRGVGSIRTLTLLDGRRVVPTNRFGTIDISLLPRQLLQRVDVVTGGASAAYGSDAVSGVVNFILDTRFTGLKGHAQAGISERGDYDNQDASLTFGTAVAETGRLLLSLEATRAAGIRGYRSRDWFRSESAVGNPVPGGPREVFAQDVHATGYTYGGLITSGPLAGTQFLEGGVPAPFVTGTLATSLTQAGGSGVDPAADLVWILPHQQRTTAFGRFSLAPTAATELFFQGLVARSDNEYEKDPPSLWGPWEATIYSDNAFLPASIRTRMADAGATSFRLGRVGNGDLGQGRVRYGSDLLSGTVGFDWRGSRWSTQAYYQYGRNTTTLHYADVLRIDRIYRGIDSVVDPASGATVCRSTLRDRNDGCIPVNLFGQGSVSPAARAWVTEGESAQTQEVDEHVAEATAQADLFTLPAGNVEVVTGFAWRAESVRAFLHRFPETLEGLIVERAETLGYRGLPESYAGAPNIFERTTRTVMQGRYSVQEIFGEAVVPVLAQQPFAEKVELHGAVRLARYSGSGRVTAWKAGIDWAMPAGFRLRATRSRDVRAGSLSERFDESNSGMTVTDRLLPGSPAYAIVATRTGNPAVDPELADTLTAGLVLQPTRWPGVSLSADYYDIRIGDAIAVPAAQSIINSCAQGELRSCALIRRTQPGAPIISVETPVMNLTQARTRGVDVELSYRQALHLFGGATESFVVRAFANRVFESSTTGTNGIRVDRAGQTGVGGGAPSWQANVTAAYERGPLRIAVQERLISSGQYNAVNTAADIDNNHVSGAAYTSLQLGWKPATYPGVSVFAGITNLFDAPPSRAGDWGFVGSVPTNESLFDVLGRRFVVGLRVAR